MKKIVKSNKIIIPIILSACLFTYFVLDTLDNHLNNKGYKVFEVVVISSTENSITGRVKNGQFKNETVVFNLNRRTKKIEKNSNIKIRTEREYVVLETYPPQINNATVLR